MKIRRNGLDDIPSPRLPHLPIYAFVLFSFSEKRVRKISLRVEKRILYLIVFLLKKKKKKRHPSKF